MRVSEIRIGVSGLTSMRWYRSAFWMIAVFSGLFQAWQYRFFIEPDGVNYLDVASAYLRHVHGTSSEQPPSAPESISP